jgi:hypothetical protein
MGPGAWLLAVIHCIHFLGKEMASAVGAFQHPDFTSRFCLGVAKLQHSPATF